MDLAQCNKVVSFYTECQDEHAKPVEEDTTLLHSIVLMYALLHVRPCCIYFRYDLVVLTGRYTLW